MKKIGIILAAVATFDLGTVVVASQSAETVHLYLKANGTNTAGKNVAAPAFTDHKIGKVDAIFKFYKIDAANTPQACMAKGGAVVTKNGQQACKSQQPEKGWVEILSF
jgi:hypothetical protein